MLPQSEQAPVRLALVITTLDPGGAELCLTKLAIGLIPRGFEPAVYVLGNRPAGNKTQLVDDLEATGIRCEFFGLRGIRHFPKAVSRLRARLREQQPDIVQSFLYHANVITAIAARRLQIPVVTGIRVAEPKTTRWLVERIATRRVAQFVCVSQDVADLARERLKVDSSRLSVIPNSIDVEEFDRAEPADLSSFGIPAAAQVILFVGRLDRQKGIGWLVEQAPGLFDELPNSHLIIVGDGPQREAIRRLIGQLGVPDRVHLAGWKSDVARFLKAASLLVLPSQWEGMPNVVLQAMACGLPVACSRTHGIRELLGEQFDQQVFSSRNTTSFLKCVTSILTNPAVGRQLGNENRIRVIRDFSTSGMLDRYEQLYREQLERW